MSASHRIVSVFVYKGCVNVWVGTHTHMSIYVPVYGCSFYVLALRTRPLPLHYLARIDDR